MNKALVISAAAGVAGAVAIFFLYRKHLPVDQQFQKEAKEKHYDINFVHRAKTEFLRLADKTGTIDKKTFVEWLKLVLHQPASSTYDLEFNLTALFDLCDTDHNGRLAVGEFLNGLAMLSSGTIEEKAKYMFDAWDTDRDGFLGVSELRQAYKKAVVSTSILSGRDVQKFSALKLFASCTGSIFEGMQQKQVDELIEAHVQQLMMMVDDNKDNKISREEWLKHAADLPFFRFFNFTEEATQIARPIAPGYKVTIACSNYKALLGEGPHWDVASRRLFYIDILGKKVLSLDPTNEDLITYEVGSLVGCMAPCRNKKGTLLISTQEGIELFELETRKRTMFIERNKMEDGKPVNRFNDGKVDSSGRLWVGTMSTDESLKKQGSFYRVDPNETFHKMFGDVSISNGIAWSLDEKTMYYTDTPTQEVVQFSYDKESGQISDKKTAITIPKELGAPDGMTIDEQGNLWIALWSGGRVTKWDPKTGSLLQMINIPAPNVTSVCFGGPNLDILYVTSASHNTNLQKYPEAGCVFAVTGLGVKGRPFNDFAI